MGVNEVRVRGSDTHIGQLRAKRFMNETETGRQKVMPDKTTPGVRWEMFMAWGRKPGMRTR